jgi:hypothetical protein
VLVSLELVELVELVELEPDSKSFAIFLAFVNKLDTTFSVSISLILYRDLI